MQGLKLLAILSALLMLASCGAAQAPAAATTPPRVVRMQIVRTVGYSRLPPLDASYTGPRIQSLYNLVFSLPMAPIRNGVVSCPLEFDLVYHFTIFFSDGTSVGGDADPNQCDGIEFGQSGLRANDDRFWNLLAQIVGGPVRVSPPTVLTSPSPTP